MRRKALAGPKDGRFNLGDGQGEGAFGLSRLPNLSGAVLRAGMRESGGPAPVWDFSRLTWITAISGVVFAGLKVTLDSR